MTAESFDDGQADVPAGVAGPVERVGCHKAVECGPRRGREPTTVEKRTKTGVCNDGSWRKCALVYSAIDS